MPNARSKHTAANHSPQGSVGSPRSKPNSLGSETQKAGSTTHTWSAKLLLIKATRKGHLGLALGIWGLGFRNGHGFRWVLDLI